VPAKRKFIEEVDAIVGRLREFLRFDYMTESEAAKRIGVNESTVSGWLRGEKKPREPDRITAFLDTLPPDPHSGIAPIGYEYREYKNWRGIPKPRRCPFCKQAKGELRKVRGGLQGVCPNCEAMGPKRDSHDDALAAWNGRIK
jgi:hypothetical protein